MIELLKVWWHREVLHHKQERRHVSVGLGDPSRGILVRCACGKRFAL